MTRQPRLQCRAERAINADVFPVSTQCFWSQFVFVSFFCIHKCLAKLTPVDVKIQTTFKTCLIKYSCWFDWMMLSRGNTRKKKKWVFLFMSCFEKLDLMPQRSTQEQNTSTEFCQVSGGRRWRHNVITSQWSPPGPRQTLKAVDGIVAAGSA